MAKDDLKSEKQRHSGLNAKKSDKEGLKKEQVSNMLQFWATRRAYIWCNSLCFVVNYLFADILDSAIAGNLGFMFNESSMLYFTRFTLTESLQ